MAKKRISVKSAKQKARRLQNKIAESISNLLGVPWGKDELVAPREMGQSGVDIRLIGKALVKFPYSVEAKNVERLNFWDAIKQAKTNQITGTDWLLIVKRNNEDPVVVMDYEAFFELQEKLSELWSDYDI